MFTVLSIEDAAKLLGSEAAWKRKLRKEYSDLLDVVKELVDDADVTIADAFGETDAYSDDEKRETYEDIICEQVDEMEESFAGKAVILAMCGVSPDILLC